LRRRKASRHESAGGFGSDSTVESITIQAE
jgi:hypothetical protein